MLISTGLVLFLITFAVNFVGPAGSPPAASRKMTR